MSDDAKPIDASGQRLSRDALIYGLGFIAQRAVSFIMLPIYTRFLTPEDYATLYLLQMSLDVATILLASGVTAGVHRFYFKTEDAAKRRSVVLAALVMLGLFNALGAVLIWALSPAIATHVLKDPASSGLILIVACSFVLDPFFTIPTLLMQVRQRSTLYTMVSLARLMIQLTLNVVFVVFLGEGVRGIILSTLIAYAVLALPLLIWFFRQIGWVFMKQSFLDLFWFGLPYRFTDAGSFILTYVDRYFLLAAHGLFLTGVYSLAYQFGFLLAYLGSVPFLMAWNPQRFQLSKEPREVRDRAYAQGHVYISMLMLSLAVGIALFVQPTLRVIADPSFHDAARYVPVIMAAYIFQGWTWVMEFGIQVSERTRFATYGTWLAVGIIVILYATLIPAFGAWGAAISTLVAFFARFVAFSIFAQRLFPVTYQWGGILRAALVACAVVGLYFLAGPTSLLLQFAAAAGLSAVFLASAWRLGLNAEQRQGLLLGLGRYWGLLRNSLKQRG